jgi:hypothetical protein
MRNKITWMLGKVFWGGKWGKEKAGGGLHGSRNREINYRCPVNIN